MATITKRSNGQWQVKIRRKGYKTQSKTFRTKATAAQWARQVESEMDRSVFVSLDLAESTTLEMLSQRYASEVLPQKKSVSESLSRIKTLNRHLGHITLADLSTSTLREFREFRLEKVSGDSVRKELSLLGRMIRHGQHEWELVLPKGNPVESISLPKKGRSRDRRLNGKEEQILLSAAREYGGQIAHIIEFAIETGMRRGEIVKLQWQNINLIARTAVLLDTKNEEDREIPLSTKALGILQALPRNISGPVFAIRDDSITQAFIRVREAAKITDLRFHDLRHEATSRFFEMGLELMEVAAITGHKDLAMLRRYTHLRASDLAKKLA